MSGWFQSPPKVIGLQARLNYPYCVDPVGHNEPERIEMATRKKGPPPRRWDGVKKLPWPLALFYSGKQVKVVAYDLDAGRFAWQNTDGLVFEVNTKPDGFLVQRLH